jgi:hypothetical protein
VLQNFQTLSYSQTTFDACNEHKLYLSLVYACLSLNKISVLPQLVSLTVKVQWRSE